MVKMELEGLKPKSRPIITQGPLYYCEGTKCNNTLRIKKKIVQEFAELKQNIPVFYQLEFHHNYQQLDERIKQLKRRKTIPLLLFFYK